MKLTKFRNVLAKKLGAVAVAAASLLPAVGILAGGLSFVGTANAMELVTNGSFEMNNGFNADNSGFGWTTVAGDDTTVGFDVYSHSAQVYYAGPTPSGAGEWYFHTVGLGSLTSTPVVVEQQVDVSGSVGMPYEFSAYIAGWSASTDTAILELEFDTTGVAATLDGLTGGADGDVTTWDRFASTGTIPAGARSATVRILQASLDANGNDNYVDLVSLTIVPEPATIGLLGIGSLLLVGLRRSSS